MDLAFYGEMLNSIENTWIYRSGKILRGAYLLKLLPVVVLLLKCAYVTLVRYYVGDAQVAKS